MPKVALIPPTAVPLSFKAPGNGKVLQAHAVELEESTGMVKLPADLMRMLKKHGVEVRDTGIVQTDMVYAFGTKAACFRCLDELETKIEGAAVESLVEIAKGMAYLSKAINGVFIKNVKSDGGDKPLPKASRLSFAAGATVNFNVQNEPKQ